MPIHSCQWSVLILSSSSNNVVVVEGGEPCDQYFTKQWHYQQYQYYLKIVTNLANNVTNTTTLTSTAITATSLSGGPVSLLDQYWASCDLMGLFPKIHSGRTYAWTTRKQTCNRKSESVISRSWTSLRSLQSSSILERPYLCTSIFNHIRERSLPLTHRHCNLFEMGMLARIFFQVLTFMCLHTPLHLIRTKQYMYK